MTKPPAKPRRRGPHKVDNDDPLSPRAVGRRLKILRVHFLGLTREEIATKIGLSPPAWHHYEKGSNAPTHQTAIKIAVKCGVTLDWIYRGERSGLVQARVKLLEALDRVEELKRDDGTDGV